MARWLLATAVAVLALAACTSAQPFNLATGATVTTNISTLASSGQFVKVCHSTSAHLRCLHPEIRRIGGEEVGNSHVPHALHKVVYGRVLLPLA